MALKSPRAFYLRFFFLNDEVKTPLKILRFFSPLRISKRRTRTVDFLTVVCDWRRVASGNLNYPKFSIRVNFSGQMLIFCVPQKLNCTSRTPWSTWMLSKDEMSISNFYFVPHLWGHHLIVEHFQTLFFFLQISWLNLWNILSVGIVSIRPSAPRIQKTDNST